MNALELKNEGNENVNVNEYKGYSLFNEVENHSLQAWNRCNVICNIQEAHGKVFAEEYAEALTENDRVKVLFMFGYIKEHGWDKVNAEVTRGNNE